MELQLVSTVVIVYAQGKFLLVQRALDDDIFPGKWQSAGGKLEKDETIEVAAKRELAEETNLDIGDDLRFVMSYSWKKSPEDPTRLGIIMLAVLPQTPQELAVQIDPELHDYSWFTLEEAAALDTIGKESPTGTYAQLQKAAQLIGR